MSLVSLTAIQAAASRIASIARRTPVLDVSDLAGRPLWLKCEPQQPGGAFKIRGATNMLKRLSADELKRGVITFSSGNHGQAVALAASRLGAPAVIVMPTTAPPIKIAGVKRWGAEVVLEGTTSVDRRKRAEAIAAERGLTMVPPFDHEWIIEGQGTCGLEILEQVPNVDIVVVPVGGGGLVSGVAAAIKQARAPERSGATGPPRANGASRGAGAPDDQTKNVRVVGVEPAGAAKMSASLAAGHPVTLDKTSSIADGLMPVRPGDHTFEHVQRFVDQMVTVDDAQIARAALWLFHEAKQVVEPSGAATVAAVLWPSPGSLLADRTATVVAILSGGNVAPETLAALANDTAKPSP
jgi:threonine dehydratase